MKDETCRRQGGYATVSVMVYIFILITFIAGCAAYVSSEFLKTERLFANVKAHWAMMGTVNALQSMIEAWSGGGAGICGPFSNTSGQSSCASVNAFTSAIENTFFATGSPLLSNWIYPLNHATSTPQELAFTVGKTGSAYLASIDQAGADPLPDGEIQLSMTVQKATTTYPGIVEHLLGTNVDADHASLVVGLCVRDQWQDSGTSKYSSSSANCANATASGTSTVGQSRVEYVRRK